MKRKQKEALYHACRLVHVATDEGVPWHMLVHALRQGLDFRKSKTHTLTKKDLQKYPQLREVITKLREAKRDKTRERKKVANQG
jgi:hypothetical protein